MGSDVVEFLVLVEDQFGIQVPEADAARIRTVGQLHDFVCSQARRFLGRDIRAEQVFEDLRDILCTRFGLPHVAVTPQARLAEDLQLQ